MLLSLNRTIDRAVKRTIGVASRTSFKLNLDDRLTQYFADAPALSARTTLIPCCIWRSKNMVNLTLSLDEGILQKARKATVRIFKPAIFLHLGGGAHTKGAAFGCHRPRPLRFCTRPKGAAQGSPGQPLGSEMTQKRISPERAI